jgi:hypothetical protein
MGLPGYEQLKKVGLSDRDIKTLYSVIEKKSQKSAAKELGITPQAVNKRWNKKILPALRRVNRHFSTQEFRAAVADQTEK